MARGWSGSMQTELAQSDLQPFLLVELSFDSGAVNLWTGYGDLTWNATTYTGAGDLLAISQVQETSDLRASKTQITLSGIPSSLVSIAEGEDYSERAAVVRLGALDDSGAIISSPIAIRTGRIDTMTVADDGDTADIVVTIESRFIDLRRPKIRQYTHEDQQIDYAGDKGFEFAADMADVKLSWGRV